MTREGSHTVAARLMHDVHVYSICSTAARVLMTVNAKAGVGLTYDILD